MPVTMPGSSTHQHGRATTDDPDIVLLNQLGYKQEFKRVLSLASNAALNYGSVAVVADITLSYSLGLQFGGPASMTVGWLVVGMFNCFIALSMAEICSSFPTAGGLYYWSAKLAGDKWGPFASWMSGWCTVLAQWTGFASGNYATAQLIQAVILLSTGGANGGGYSGSAYVTWGIYAALTIMGGLINALPLSTVSFIANASAIWNVAAFVVLTILLPTVSVNKASAEYIFTYINRDNGVNIDGTFYILSLGLLMSQFSLAGYDASAHMTEETKGAAWSGPIGICITVFLSVVLGWIYIVAIAITVTDIPYLLDTGNDAGGYAVAQLFYLVFKQRFGSGVGGIICLGTVVVPVILSNILYLTANSRLVYAFARDRAMPLSKLWSSVNKQDVPMNAVWLSVILIVLFGLTSLGSSVAFQAMASISSIGCYLSYAIPIFIRITVGRKSFVPGPFSLGRFSLVVGWLSVFWVALTSALFSLPVAFPITSENFNYTPVTVGGALLLCLASWFFTARHWFSGPINNVNDDAP